MSDFGRYRRVHSNSWLQSDVRSLNDAEKVVWFYCITGLQSTSVGVYRISSAVAVEEIGGGITAEDFDSRFAVVREAMGWRYDPEVRLLWMPEWLERNPPQSPNVTKSWRKLLNGLPECELKYEATEAAFRFLRDERFNFHEDFRKAFGSLPKDFLGAKAKPKAKAQAYQGSGNQGSFRETGKQTPLRGGQLNKRLIRIAKLAMNVVAPSVNRYEIHDAFEMLANGEQPPLEYIKADAEKAIDAAIAERNG